MRACLTLLFVLSAVAFPNSGPAWAQERVAHPYIPEKAVKPDICLICHPAKRGGKYVHTAVALGCESCHRVTSADQETTITLVAPVGDLCARCHATTKDPVLHGPYKAGQCLMCHDPHTGDFPSQVRAPANTLCLSCHGFNQPDVKIDSATDRVTLLGNQQMDYEEYRQAPKIKLDPSGTSGHPVAGHPLTGMDPRKKDAALSCLSCHEPHSSAVKNLLPAGIKTPAELCALCHKQST